MTDDVVRTWAHGPSDPPLLSDCPGTAVETVVAAPPERVWEVVTDLGAPAAFSEEFQGAAWTSEPGPGATFTGRNAHPAIGEWEVPCFVLAWEPPRTFAWGTSDPANPGATWRFDLEPEGGGTRLRFSMQIGPGPSGISRALEAMPDKAEKILHRRISEHAANMRRTVDGLRGVCEQGAP